MSKKFDAEEYVSRWDDKLIPIMLVVIVASMVGVYTMNVMLRPACTTHEYVFCGTPLDEPSEESGVPHDAPGGPHAPAGQSQGHETSAHPHSH